MLKENKIAFAIEKAGQPYWKLPAYIVILLAFVDLGNIDGKIPLILEIALKELK